MFWRSLVPTFSQIDPNTLKLVQCVSTMHKQWRAERYTPDAALVGLPCTLKDDCARALSGILLDSGDRPKLTRVTACLLLLVIQLLRGHAWSAYTLVGRCRSLVESPTLQYVDSPSDDEVMSKELMPMLRWYEESILAGIHVQRSGQPRARTEGDSDLCIAISELLINPRRPP